MMLNLNCTPKRIRRRRTYHTEVDAVNLYS